MSADTLRPAATPAATPWYRTELLHGTAWLSWRQNRWLVVVGAAVVAVLAVLLSSEAHQIDLALAVPRHLGGTCGVTQNQAIPGLSAACQHLYDTELSHTDYWLSLDQVGLTGLPLLIGMFVGAPLLAREYERRTHWLAWTQSVSRTRWFAAQLAMAAAVVLLATTALTALSDWFWHDYVASSSVLNNYRFADVTYASTGVMPVVYSLYALALGVAVGLLLRRTLPAIGVAGLLTGLTQFVLYQLRRQLYPAVSVVQPTNGGNGFIPPPGAWTVTSGVILPNGSRVAEGTGCTVNGCGPIKGYYGSYQPASHFWPLQFVESGILLALTLALLALVLHRVRRGSA